MKYSAVLFLSLIVIISECNAVFNAKGTMLWKDVVKSIDPNVNQTWIDTAYPDGWFMPMMSQRAAKNFARILTGKADLKNWDNFCIKELWQYPIAIYPGFGEQQVAKCTTIEQVPALFSCTFWSDVVPERKAMAFTSYSDNVDIYIIVRVWQDQEKDWIVYSPHRTITKEKMKLALEHVESLGFKSKHYTNVDYTNCVDIVF